MHGAEWWSIYIPPDLVLGRHVFFAVDNVDFAEDTPYGKNTFHGTAMAIYQRQEPGDVAPELTVDPGDQCRRSIRQLPESVTTLLECPAPPGRPVGPTFPQFGLCTEDQLPLYIKKQDFTWLLGRSLTRTITNGEVEDDQPPSTDIPVWSGYNPLWVVPCRWHELAPLLWSLHQHTSGRLCLPFWCKHRILWRRS